MSNQALQSLEVGLKARIRHFNALSPLELVGVAMRHVDEAAVEYETTETIPAVLARVAALGSIDAVAIMVAMGCPQKQLTRALRALTDRSEDVKEGMLIAGLTTLFEEWADEEVAAGRMTKSICPTTGKTLYSSVGKS